MKKLLLILVLSVLLSGCGGFFIVDVKEAFMEEKGTQKSTETAKPSPTIPPSEGFSGTLMENVKETREPIKMQKPSIDYKNVKPNEIGRIMIIMYHGIVENNPATSYQRTAEDFRNDLNTLYDRGYRLISMKDLVTNNINVEAGKTPVIITFDDGLSTEFSFSPEKVDGKYAPAKNCGVDILNNFCKEHPDFGKGATIFINDNPFPGVGTLREKFSYLLENGYDLGNHTYSHPVMTSLTESEVLAEYGKIDKLIRENTDGYAPFGIAQPNGIRPVENLRHLIQSGEYEGNKYEYFYSLAVGASGKSAAPNHVNYDPFNLPRCRASSDDPDKTDLWGLLEHFENNPDEKYVSDGDPLTIAVPKNSEHLVNKDSLNGLDLIIY